MSSGYPEAWYILCATEDLLKRSVWPVRVADRDLVVFADKRGGVGCLEDRCCHRGARLSNGSVRVEGLACPGHGWTFDCRGRCRRIPSLADADRIPSGAEVRAYPIVSASGYHWAWFGGARPAPFEQAFGVAEFAHPGFRVLKLRFSARFGFRDGLDNLMDIAHVPFVHVFPHVQADERRLLRSLVLYCVRSDGVSLLAGRPSSRRAELDGARIHIAFTPPNRVRLDFLTAPADGVCGMIAYFIPESEDRTTVEAAIFFRGPDLRARSPVVRIDHTAAEDPYFSVDQVLDEDLRVLLAQASRRREHPRLNDLLVPSDVMVSVSRRFERARRPQSDDSPSIQWLECMTGVDVPNWPPRE